MNNVNMAGLNPHVGGPVGGGAAAMMMNSASMAGQAPIPTSRDDMIKRFNTYIYDYFIKSDHIECAKALVHNQIPMFLEDPAKTSPNRRRDGEVNGIEPDSMDADSKEEYKYPEDIPRPRVPGPPQTAFIFEWFSLFHEMFMASRRKNDGSPIGTYISQSQALQRLRDQGQQQQLLRNQQMGMPGQPGFNSMRRMGNGMPDMQKAAMQRNINQAQMQQRMHQQMQRENSDVDMNGHRSQSPASAEHSGSPSKRPRLEGGPQFNGQMAPNGRGQPMNPNANSSAQMLLMANGVNPKQMNPAQLQAFSNTPMPQQQKSLQVFNQAALQFSNRSAMQGTMPNGMMNPAMMQQNQEMMQQDGSFMQLDSMYNNPRMNPGMNQQNQSGGGNHALQDYQMQLMLLEQQNKKRLLMARQEQEGSIRPDAQPGMQPPGMSPTNSRNGPSPNPSDQMKRGTPQIGQNTLPGSPAPGELAQNRGSPAAAGMNFPGGMPPELQAQMINQAKNVPDGLVPAAQAMRQGVPMGPQGGTRIPSGGNWQGAPQGQPVMGQAPQAQPQAMGTPSQRNSDMPPPAQPTAQSRTQPSSPQPSQAPPTPQPSNKANPKGKKDKNAERKRPAKKASVAQSGGNANEKSEGEPPPTPTPSTPITPVHPQSFNSNAQSGSGNKGPATTSNPTNTSAPNANMPTQSNANGPTSVPAQASSAQAVVQPQQELQQQTPFGDFNPGIDQQFSLDFSTLDTGDVLESFDFDSFLNTDNNDFGTLANFDPTIMDNSGGAFGLGGGMEADGGVNG
ncbi:MAG: hypothetical protein Q9160_000492 [Pyrenula sp. 1 TL-2023]